MTEPLVIRASSLSSFGDCQLRAAGSMFASQFQAHGHDVRRPRANIGALIGTGVHRAAEVALTEKMVSSSTAALSTMEDAAVESFRQRMAEDAGDLPVVMDQETPTIAAALSQIPRLVRRYRDDVVEHVVPVEVESRIEAEAMPGVILSGQADLLVLDAAKGRRTLRDAKTGRRRQNPWKHAPQCGAYSALFRSRGYEVDAGQIDFLARVKEQAEQPPVEEQKIDIIACEQIAWHVLQDFGSKALAFAADGDPGRFLPNPGSHLCSPLFCRLYGSSACAATKGAPDAA